MRILHTSDWHLGRTLKGVDLTSAHEAVIARVAAIVEQADVDVVVIAGDVYDRAIPHTDAVRLLGSALARMCTLVPVVMTPGNHDSAVRLGFGAGLFTDRLHIRASLAEAATPILLADEHGPVAFYGLPFLDPEEVRQFARQADGLDIARTQAAAADYMMGRIRADLNGRQVARAVVIAHTFVVDAAAAHESSAGDPVGECGSDSERDITAGGLDFVPSETFDGVSYVALGHLHGPQTRRPSTSGTVLEYSGSPLRFSFSERDHRKSVTIVDLDAEGAVTTDRVALPQPRGMAQLRGPFAELLRAGEDPPAGAFAGHVDDWVDIVVTDERRPEEMRARLLRAFPHMLSHQHLPAGAMLDSAGLGSGVRATAAPLEVMTTFVSEVSTGQATPAEVEVLRSAADVVFDGRG
jgi:exonuclease SbcD